jgi:hypothetical protein
MSMLLLAAPGAVVGGSSSSLPNDGPEGSLSLQATGDWVYEPSSNGIVIENDYTYLADTFTGEVSTGNGEIPFFNDGSDQRDWTTTVPPTGAPSMPPNRWVGATSTATTTTGSNHWMSSSNVSSRGNNNNKKAGNGNRHLRGSER